MNQYTTERLATVGALRPWPPALVQALAARLGEPDDARAFRIDARDFAAENKADPDEALDLLLHAAKHGLLDMTWSLVCPACGDNVKNFAAVGLVESKFHCRLCRLETDVCLDDWVHVTFTAHPQVRPVKHRHPETLPIMEYISATRFTLRGRTADGQPFIEIFRPMIRHITWVEPSSRTTLTLDFTPGLLHIYDFSEASDAEAEVGAGKNSTLSSSATYRFQAGAPSTTVLPKLCAGKVSLTLDNPTSIRRAVIVMNYPPGAKNGRQIFDPFLTGRDVLGSQTFQTLFKGESVGSAQPLGVREMTFLFTDLKGSTALYGRIGDMKAFGLVRRHFETLANVIVRHHGALVKTIGDAVMASFTRPADAVKAATAMVREVEEINRHEGGRDLILKIGVHSGATIAVTLNDRLDYFGQTVNIAARVQGMAAADEICITAGLLAEPAVQAVIKGAKIVREHVELRGVDGKREIGRLRIAPEAKLKKAG